MIKLIKPQKLFKKKCRLCNCKFSYLMTDTYIRPYGNQVYRVIKCIECGYENIKI